MERWLLAIVAGLVGGAGGALAVDLVRGTPAPATAASDAASHAGLSPEILERLARMEALLEGPRAAPPPLEGRQKPLEAGTSEDPAEEARLKRIESRVEAAVERKVKEMGIAPAAEKPVETTTPKKKRLTLAEASSELGLSRGEEDTVRRIYDEANERILKLIAGEGGDVDAVRKDLEAAKTEKGRQVVMMKYLPKMLPKIGELMTIGMDRDAKVEEALGAERAARWEGFDVEEGNPLGLGASVRMEARDR